MKSWSNSDHPTILGLLFEGHNPSAVLLRNGEIAAFVEEERFVRDKHAADKFPRHAAEYCLSEANISLEAVDYIAVGWDAARFPASIAQSYLEMWYHYQPCSRHVLEWQLTNLSRYTPENLRCNISKNLFQGITEAQQPKIRFIKHHLAHACSAYLPSGFDDAVIITADGHGEDDCTNIWLGEQGEIQHVQEWKLPHSLGWFYTKFTQWFGFRPHDGEGKLMGLAAYGKEVLELSNKIEKVMSLTGDPQVYEVNARFFYDDYGQDGPYTLEWISLFGQPRPLESRAPFSDYHKNLAYAVQAKLELVCLALVECAMQITGKSKVCVAGGTFMNCKVNGAIARKIGLKNFFAQPVAADNGISLGAALAVCNELSIRWSEPLKSLYYGPSFTNIQIETALKSLGVPYRQSLDVEKETANYLSKAKVVGWFQGRMEVGARALGNRSILADPTNLHMQEIVNNRVKLRENWRPFCPAVADTDCARYFDHNHDLPFMIISTDVKPHVKEMLPSVVHIDNSVRVQTVTQDVNPRFHKLIKNFKKLTGHGVLLNTSFNIRGEPIVCTPEQAIQCFLNTEMDILAIGDFIIEKQNTAQIQ